MVPFHTAISPTNLSGEPYIVSISFEKGLYSIENALSVRYLALPNNENVPSLLPQHFGVSTVPQHVRVQFPRPKRLVT